MVAETWNPVVGCPAVGDRLDTKDVSDLNFIVLCCPFNLLRIFKDGAHRSKKEFILGPSSSVKSTSDTDIPCPPPWECDVFIIN